MTVLVGVRCKDGVVIGADSMATSSTMAIPLVQISTDKIAIVGDRIILAGSGSVGLGQRFEAVVQSCHDQKHFQKRSDECLKIVTATAVQNFQATGVPFAQRTGFGFGALMAVPLDGKAELVEFGIADMQPEIKKGKIYFVAMGSGQMLAEPFLAFICRVIWKGEPPDVKSGAFGVYWALQHTTQFAPGGVAEPIRLAVLKKEKDGWKARLLSDEECQEQAQHINEIEQRIAKDPAELIATAEVKAPPKPPAR